MTPWERRSFAPKHSNFDRYCYAMIQARNDNGEIVTAKIAALSQKEANTLADKFVDAVNHIHDARVEMVRALAENGELLTQIDDARRLVGELREMLNASMRAVPDSTEESKL